MSTQSVAVRPLPVDAYPVPRAPSIETQTGWRRSHPQALCQDFDLRQRITSTDFDLHDQAFLRYAERRGVLYLAGTNLRAEIVADHHVTKSEFMQSDKWQPLRWWIHHKSGERIRLQTTEELETSWRIIRAAKGALQDAWELYQPQQAATH